MASRKEIADEVNTYVFGGQFEALIDRIHKHEGDPSYKDVVRRRIAVERARQSKEYADDRSLPPSFWYLILAEEVGEVAKDILENKPLTMEEEIVQVAAVAIAWLEDIEIQRGKNV